VYAGGLIKMGSTGSQVKDLQTCLADMGVNDAKNIDGIFGAKTKAAVMAFQASKAVKVDGVIGPVTGPLYTTACAADMADDEVDADAFDGTGGDEASLEDFDLSDEKDAEEGKSMHIATIEFDVEDGDVMIERLDLSFFPSATPTEDEPWEAFDTLTLMADGDEIGEMDIDDEDDWQEENYTDAGVVGVYNSGTDSAYVFRVNGLEYIVKDGDMAEIEVYLTSNNSVDDAGTDANWAVFVVLMVFEESIQLVLTQEIGDDSEITIFSIENRRWR
jgi:hypothetical protein